MDLRASFLRTFFAIALGQNFRRDEAHGSYDVASHDLRCEVAGKYVRAFAHVQRHVPSTVRAGPNKASEMAQQGTKRVRTAMAEDQETQVFSPTKRVRSEPTREEEEEEDDDDLDMSGSQDVDASP